MSNIEKLRKNLEHKGYQTSYFKTAGEAADYLCKEITDTPVGIGGSKTVDDLGLFDRLSENNEVYWHWKQDPNEAREKAASADIFICSANAVSETGDLVNIDAMGNRLAATIYGKKKVYIVIGANKIKSNLKTAVWRARNIAAPMNAKRLGLSTPCATSKEVRCYDCRSSQRICKGLLIMLEKMNGVGACEVVIVNDSLGY